MTKLKFAQAGYENYTGPIGAYEFIDGVSLEDIPPVDRDRLAAAFQFVDLEEDNTETPSGIAHRLVAERKVMMPPIEPLERQTESEKCEERLTVAKASLKRPDIYTYEELQAKVDKGGIAALREIAAPWNVKHRALNVLMQMVLDAQTAWVASEDSRLAAKIDAESASIASDTPDAQTVEDAAVTSAEALSEGAVAAIEDIVGAITDEDEITPDPVEPVSPKTPEETIADAEDAAETAAMLEAARSGDLSAAVTDKAE